MEKAIPRPEYPRPDFVRNDWLCLNGVWKFTFDDADKMEKDGSYASGNFDKDITVPFCYQSAMSGIGDRTVHPVVWYGRNFDCEVKSGKILLHFGAVDYLAKVWLNGVYVGSHTGGNVGFCLDITNMVKDKDNLLIVKAEDYNESGKPRGKQSWTGETFGCWYTATTGIWQPVWIEYAGDVYFKQVKITPDLDQLSALCEVFLSSPEETYVMLTAHFTVDGRENTLVSEMAVRDGYGKVMFAFPDLDIRNNQLLWSPEEPNLITVDCETVNLANNDFVQTYFGMRKISVMHGRVMLNNHNLFQRLILDQGYWKESLLTPPTDEAIKEDIRLTKAMGFNGARKHQKIEDPRYYYWADKMGLLVWGEMPSAYNDMDDAKSSTVEELTAFIKRDFNHPCIVTWVTINESWGVRLIGSNKQQQDYARALYYLAKAYDKTRLVSSNDGWEQLNETDICALHDYALFAENLDKYDDLEKIMTDSNLGRLAYASDQNYQNQPIIMTEYGGIAFSNTEDKSWGYFGKVNTEDEFFNRLTPVTEYFAKSRKFCGFCYTQLTDVMQEVNGLLTEDRKPKVSIERLRNIFGKHFY